MTVLKIPKDRTSKKYEHYEMLFKRWTGTRVLKQQMWKSLFYQNAISIHSYENKEWPKMTLSDILNDLKWPKMT